MEEINFDKIINKFTLLFKKKAILFFKIFFGYHLLRITIAIIFDTIKILYNI